MVDQIRSPSWKSGFPSHQHQQGSYWTQGSTSSYLSTAKTAGVLGDVAEKANKIAPILTTAAVIYEMYQVGKEVKKDYHHGTTRNTIKTVATTATTYASASAAALAGSSIGSAIFPGIGTIFGGIIGGIAGGLFGGHVAETASEQILTHVKYDVTTLTCKECGKDYDWKKYEEAQGVCSCQLQIVLSNDAATKLCAILAEKIQSPSQTSNYAFNSYLCYYYLHIFACLNKILNHK
ncbi:uncharacterized protein CELE_C06E1.11 [Caenorhabditis elegans]|uniref:Uncharacterized protein C06E1.11 n=1 Tax=Caenorhabditis elegans TaxID=6239 RepID=YKQA_CAEEL|nr:Uncharacterized protein CELE_C06E1.11 [Caenorhabditis elegans]P34306.2 RecName: Full=Uncharacterized protein C06E1.11 [Caenorhabditis elegans]CCD62571.2 Uncharacterized protein CELE_C06E1.11 [Caenorhabditis elegans]